MQPFAGRRRRERSTVGRRPLGSVLTVRSESEAEATGRRARAKAERAEGPLRARSAAPKGAAPRGRHSLKTLAWDDAEGKWLEADDPLAGLSVLDGGRVQG